MNTTFDHSSHYADDFEVLRDREAKPREQEQDAVKRGARYLDQSLAGAGLAILLWMALFAGFLYSWFTLGR